MVKMNLVKRVCPLCNATNGNWQEFRDNEGNIEEEELCLNCLDYAIPVEKVIGSITHEEYNRLLRSKGLLK